MSVYVCVLGLKALNLPRGFGRTQSLLAVRFWFLALPRGFGVGGIRFLPLRTLASCTARSRLFRIREISPVSRMHSRMSLPPKALAIIVASKEKGKQGVSVFSHLVQ